MERSDGVQAVIRRGAIEALAVAALASPPLRWRRFVAVLALVIAGSTAASCVDIGCSQTSDCRVGQRCGAHNFCVDGCDRDEDCGSGQLCIDGGCSDGLDRKVSVSVRMFGGTIGDCWVRHSVLGIGFTTPDDIAMDRSSVRAALTITPGGGLLYEWRDEGSLSIHPDEEGPGSIDYLWVPGNYTVSLRATAQTIDGHTLDRDYSYEFCMR